MDSSRTEVLVSGKIAIGEFCHRFQVDESTRLELIDLWRNFETHEENRVFVVETRTREEHAYRLLLDLTLQEEALVKAYCTKYPCMKDMGQPGLDYLFILRRKIREITTSKLDPNTKGFIGH